MREFIVAHKKQLTIVGLSLIVLAMGFALVTKGGHSTGQVFVNIDKSSGMMWLSNADILNIVHPAMTANGETDGTNNLNPDAMKQILEQNPFIKRADVYIDANSDMHISIQPTVAIIRVINMQGVSYYLSSTGQVMPLSSNFTPRVVVATGAILNNGFGDHQNDTAFLHTLFFVAKKIYSDTFLNALAEQLVIDKTNGWTIIPKWGRAKIEVGDTQDWDDKMLRLKAFYMNRDKDQRWPHYTDINLKFAGQVVCTRDDIQLKPVDPVIDSAKLKTDSGTLNRLVISKRSPKRGTPRNINAGKAQHALPASHNQKSTKPLSDER